MTATLTHDEAARLAALRSLDILDTPAEAAYDDLTSLAAAVFSAPIAAVSLIDAGRQWFKSKVGIAASETPRSVAFCDHALRGRGVMVVPDATQDDRFRDNPFVTGDPNIRFYAGAPLADIDGYSLGTLCVIDRTPRQFSAEDSAKLALFARQVTAHLQLRQHALRLENELAERRRTEQALRESEAKFRNTVESLAEGVVLVDSAAGRFVEANRAVLAMLGYELTEFLALTPFDLAYGETAEAITRHAEHTRARLAADGRCDCGRRQFRRKDGSPVPVEVRVTTVPGTVLDAVIVRDVTDQDAYENRLFDYQSELEAANSKLRALATTDGLTGLRNRAALNERLAEEFDRSERHGRALSIVLLDVDHFKQFNDSFGHPAGDEVLKDVAKCLESAARTTDVVARYGGEEFAVLLPETDFTGAMVMAERCRRAVAGAKWDLRPITISVGVGTRNLDTPSPSALLSQADNALYASKRAGRNRVNHGSGAFPMLAVTR